MKISCPPRLGFQIIIFSLPKQIKNYDLDREKQLFLRFLCPKQYKSMPWTDKIDNFFIFLCPNKYEMAMLGREK